ncbi:hypothetical protein RRSWK_04827 [Rhodopirellula sp. SWK7]|nr:hypothetical protein RRSWK_04827 [Rhodopirellula sp. SWK7]
MAAISATRIAIDSQDGNSSQANAILFLLSLPSPGSGSRGELSRARLICGEF